MHACHWFGFMFRVDPHACCRFAHTDLTRVPACLGMTADATWPSAHGCMWWERGCSSLFPCLLKPACAFSIPPTANLTARANLFPMTTSHTPTCPHSKTRTHTHFVNQCVSSGWCFFQWNLMNSAAVDQYLVRSCLRRRFRQTRVNFARVACGPSAPPPTLHTDKHESNWQGESYPNP